MENILRKNILKLSFLFIGFFFLFCITTNALAACYPQNVRLSPSCNNGGINSTKVTWDGSNCVFCIYTIYWNDSGGSHKTNYNNGCTNYSNSSTTVYGTNMTGNVGVSPLDTSANGDQITYASLPSNFCIPPTPTSSPTPINTPTSTPSPTPSGPTATPTITPTPTPIFTTGDLTVHYEGIDKDNTPLPGGQNHTSRHIVMFLYKDDPNGVDFSKTKPTYVLPAATVQLQSSDTNSQDYGFFRNKNFPMKGVISGNYYILVKATEGSLVEEVGNGLIPIVGGQNNILVNIDGNSNNQDLPTQPPLLHMGDIITDCTGTDSSNCSYNSVDILDYNALKDCFGPNITSGNCLNHHLSDGHDYNIADINDYNGVDGVDYTILLKNYGHTGVGGITQNGGKDH